MRNTTIAICQGCNNNQPITQTKDEHLEKGISPICLNASTQRHYVQHHKSANKPNSISLYDTLCPLDYNISSMEPN